MANTTDQYLSYIDYGGYRYAVGDIVSINTNYIYNNTYTDAIRTNDLLTSATFKITRIGNADYYYYQTDSKYKPINPLEVTIISSNDSINGNGGALRLFQIIAGSGGTGLSYTVTLHANGGTLPNGSSLIVTMGSGNYWSIGGYCPSLTGYSFKGFYTSTSGGEQVYNSSGQAVSGTYWNGSGSSASWKYAGNIDLYAQWQINQYTLTINPNGGTYNGSSSSTTVKQNYNSTYTVGTPTRSYYNFSNWSKSGSGALSGSTFTFGAGNATLTANWSAWTHTVTFNENGGTGVPSSQTKTYGSTLTLSSTKPTKSGYTFVGWGTNSSDTSVDYSAGGSYTRDQNGGTYTLYAIWKKTLTLAYNANGGSNTPSSSSKDVYNSTTNASFSISSATPARSGYTFIGWNTSNTATSASYNSGDTITISSNTTLYAIWKKTLTLSYNANGGSGAPNSQSKDIYNATTSASFTVSSTIPKYVGYTFLGWSTSTSSETASYVGGNSISISSNTTLHAVWEPANIVFYRPPSDSWHLCNSYFRPPNSDWKHAIMFKKIKDTWYRSILK